MLVNNNLNTFHSVPHNYADLLDVSELAIGFIPAFRNLMDDETHISTDDEGLIATEHRIDNLPIEWVAEWATDGYANSLLPTIIAGYLRDGRFYSLPELMQMPLDA